jgi:F-type H+-transporting ATPase subunit delta
MKKVPLSVARRYARALLDVAIEKGNAPAMADCLREAAALLAQHADLRSAILHPALAVDKKRKIAKAIWGGGDPLFDRLVDLLVERGRVAQLPAISVAYLELWNQHRGVVAAEAVSAVALAAPQQQALIAAAKNLAGREVSLSASVDPQLLGGVVLRMDGRTYDGSVRTQLQRLRTKLTSGELSSSSSRSSPRS